MTLKLVSYRFYKRRVNKSRCNSHYTFNIDNYTTVATDTNKFSYSTLKNTAHDTHLLASYQLKFSGFYINNRLVEATTNKNETTQQNVWNDNRKMMLPIHYIAYRDVHTGFILQCIDTLTSRANENKVMHGRNKLTNATTIFHDIIATHRNEILYLLFIQKSFQSQFTAICDTYCEPVEARRDVHVRIFFGDTGVVKYLPIILCNAVVFNNLFSIHLIPKRSVISIKKQ